MLFAATYPLHTDVWVWSEACFAYNGKVTSFPTVLFGISGQSGSHSQKRNEKFMSLWAGW